MIVKLSKNDLKKIRHSKRQEVAKELVKMANLDDVRDIAWVAGTVDDKTKDWILELASYVKIPF